MKLFGLKLLLALYITFLISQYAFSADSTFVSYTELMAIHPKASIGLNIYKSMFVRFQNSIDCGLFESGFGFGYSAGLAIEKEISIGSYIAGGIYYIDRSGAFTIESTLPIREPGQANVDDYKSENRLSTNISFLEIFPEYRYRLMDDFINGPLGVVAGFRLAFPISHNFTQKEQILSPDNAVFKSNNKRERLIADGDINTINSIHYGFSAGIENLLKISENTYFSQQIIFDYNLNNVASDITWSLYAIRLELGLRFGIMQKNEFIIPEQPVIDTIKKEIPIVVAKEKLLSIKFKDDKPDLKIMTGNELLATLPFVNAIFFETNSAEIPKHYIQKDTLLPSLFYGDAIDKREYILLRVAEIVKQNPNAKILIAGATAGTDKEPEGIELAKKRAINVKNSLVSLGIPDSLITSSESILPQSPSNQDFPEGILENQRADIFIRNAPLQEYVGFQKYAEVKGNVDIMVEHENLPELNEIILEPKFYDTLIICSQPGIYKVPVKKRIVQDKDSFALDAEISYRNIIKSAEIKLSANDFETIQSELLLENFKAVIRFDYNSFILSDENKELINQLVKIIPKNSELSITGSADALGSEQQNIELANLRAKAAEDYINQISQSAFNISIKSKYKKFSENTPEGRFLNRAISIEIK